MFQVEVVQCFYLVHPDELIRYQFTICDSIPSMVLIVKTVDTTPYTYLLLVEEARQLWRRLRYNGYERE